MFKRFIDRIVEAVSERANPIVVRDMRRTFKYWPAGIVIIYNIFLLVFYCSSTLHLSLSDINRSVVTSYGFWRVDILWLIASFGIIISVLQSVFIVCFRIFQNTEDEMFLITAITPRQYLQAYMFETFICTFFYISLLVPLVLIIFSQTSDFLVLVSIMVIMLFSSILLSQIAVLITLSFIAHIRCPTSRIYIMGVLYLVWILFSFTVIPCFLWTFWWIDYFGWQVIYETNCTFGFVSIYILLPISLLLVGVMAYRLSLYALKTREESIVKVILYNFLYYTFLNIVMTLIYF
ncbi:MAG: hypothetical protein LBL39_00765, partial [Planctomycetaceae bacterium]|nr:hypothetical protein [Planctomycetaceae bacterium]